jgi:integrase
MGKPRLARNRALPPHLYVNKAGYYYFKNPTNKKVLGLGRDKAQAMQEARAANAALAAATPSSLADWVMGKKAYSLTDWLPVYQELWVKRSDKAPAPNTLRACGVFIRKLAKWDLAWMQLADFTTAHVAALLEAEEAASGAASALQLRSRAADMFRMAETQGLIPQGANPVTATYTPSRAVRRERLTLEQFNTIRACASVHLQRAMDLALLTGQRRDDITKLKFADVKDGYLHVVQGKSQGAVKIQLDTQIRLAAVGKSIGEVIEACRDNILSRYIVHHVEHRGKAKPGDKLDSNGMSNMFQNAREEAEIKAAEGRTPPSFHEIRSLAQRLYREQYGAEFAKAILGHKHISMTDKYNDMRGQGWQMVSAK